ncbi:MAG: sigma 54-interacting transcriptional regulator [Syntrophobacteraceae bacterium]
MKLPDVLLIDLGKRETFSAVLRGAMQSSSIMRVHVLKSSFEAFEAGGVEASLARLASFFDPDLIVLVLPAGRLKNAGLRLSQPNRSGYIPLVSIDIPRFFGVLMIVKADAPAELLEAADGEGIMSVMWSAIDNYPLSAFKASAREDLKPASLIGRNPLFVHQLDKVSRAAVCNSGVLIEGEPGTGRNTFARRIHLIGNRAGKPFVRVDCRVIPPDLAEKELFGLVTRDDRGAALSTRGLIQKAQGGTLFLEEIDRLPPSAQIRLLHLLRNRVFRPLGAKSERPADVRLIASLANSAEDSMRNGKLRRDFYYAVSVISIKLPALRERREDIPPLARHFLNGYRAKFRTRAASFSEEVLRRFAFYDWPGNIRELKHSVERAASRSRTSVIREIDVCMPCRNDPLESLQEAKQRFISKLGRKAVHEKYLVF